MVRGHVEAIVVAKVNQKLGVQALESTTLLMQEFPFLPKVEGSPSAPQYPPTPVYQGTWFLLVVGVTQSLRPIVRVATDDGEVLGRLVIPGDEQETDVLEYYFKTWFCRELQEIVCDVMAVAKGDQRVTLRLRATLYEPTVDMAGTFLCQGLRLEGGDHSRQKAGFNKLWQRCYGRMSSKKTEGTFCLK